MIAEEIMVATPDVAAAAVGVTATVAPSLLETIFDLLAPYWMEIAFLISFPLGYMFINLDFTKGRAKPAKKSPPMPRSSNTTDGRAERLQRSIEEDMVAGDPEKALGRWRKARDIVPSTVEGLRSVVQALVAVKANTLLNEVAEHMERHASQLCNAKYALAVLDAVGHGKHPELLDSVSDMLQKRLSIPMTFQWYEALLGGHAFAGNCARVDELCSQIALEGQKLTARGYALIIKGFLMSGMLDVAIKHIQSMRAQGFYVPSFAVTLLFKTASDHQRVEEMFEFCIGDSIALPEEAVAAIFEDCLKRTDLDLASRIENLIRESNNGAIPVMAYDPLLKLHIATSDPRALELWRELVRSGTKLGEGLLVSILSRSADSKYLRFAEEVVQWCRANRRMTVAMYSALMKVYAFSGQHDRACDLYPEICEAGLVPDSIMYGCLMRFSVECGRTELSKELAEKAPQLDTQNYMSLIRAAGRDKDVARAFALLKKIEATESKIDVAVYNCVLDACVCAGDLTRARRFVEDMHKRFGHLDIITYNTLVKGVTAAGDVRGARLLLKEMAADGVKPNDITYNCIVNACGSTGDFQQAWEFVEAMRADGIKADHYTLSILLKALKRHGGPREVQKVLSLLDSSKIDVCREEVLMNTLLEVCTQLGETRRLQDLINAFDRANMKPSLHLYGALIKASSALKRVRKCRELWTELTEERGMEPNEIVLGCMMDALVCNKCVSEAVELFKRWKSKLGSNMIMISTLVKGFAAEGRADEAMTMWREVKGEGAVLNAVVYNALIDAQARAGRTEEVAVLFEGMKADGLTPDAITYSTMVKSHCVKGDLNRALEVLSDMQSLGLCKDCVVFNTVLDWCTRHNRMDVADRVLQKFESLNIAPTNFTVGILVKMYGRRRMLDDAFKVARELPAKWGFKANAQVFTCLMSACFLNNSLDRAFEVFQELRLHGVDSKSYGVLIGGCVKAGKVRDAAELVEDAYGLSGRKRMLPAWSDLGAEVLEPLFRSLAQRGLSEEVGKPLLARLRAASVQVDFHMLVQACEDTSVRSPPRRDDRGTNRFGRAERNWGDVRRG